MHVAMLLTPGMGHLIPFTELAKKLIQQNNSITITFILPNECLNMSKPQKKLLQSIPTLNTTFLPRVNLSDLPNNTSIEDRIFLSVIRSLPALHDSLSQLHESIPLSVFVIDLFGTPSFNVAKELGLSFYIFLSSSAMFLSLVLHPHITVSPGSSEFPELVMLPGCVPFHSSDLPDALLHGNMNEEVFKECMLIYSRYLASDGIIVNDFLDLEPETFKSFEEEGKFPPIFAVGPLIQSGSTKEHKCLKWLDEQLDGSVLYISFGSGGTLSYEQLKELALGLEMSEQKFIWVVKTPHDKARNASYFSIVENERIDQPFEFLPSDFKNRTKGRGFLLDEWAPQIEILAHPSIGGFVTHCGWNSVLESIVHGVPIIAWPLFAEQRMNAVLLCDDLKVAFRVRENEDGIIDRKQIAKLARNLIEGKEEGGIKKRNRMICLKGAAGRAMAKDGYSTKSLAKVVQRWMGAE